MKIYIDESKRVIAVDKPTANTTEIELQENEPFYSIPKTNKLCCCYDKGSFWYALPHDIADLLNAKQNEIDTLNGVIDTMIIAELEGM